MKPIRVFDRDLNLQSEISNYASLMFVRSWTGVGDLELRINRYKNHVETLQKGNLIVIGSDLHKVYRILHKEIELDENGKITENWLIKGLELKSVTGQRITEPPKGSDTDNVSGSAETVMKHYVHNNLFYPADIKRRIDQLIIAPNQNRGANLSWQSRYKGVDEELESISLLSNLGWNLSVDYDLKKWVFDVKSGKDLTVNQTDNNPVIFSSEFSNVKSLNFSDSDLNFKNMAYVAGQGEGSDRRVYEMGESTGLDRQELFVDARDVAELNNDEQPRPESDIINDLTTRGEQKLAERRTELFLEAQIMTPIARDEYEVEESFITPYQVVEEVTKKTNVYSTFMYELDYDLGDKVTIQEKGWNVTMDARITEITEIYEVDGFKLEAVFGNSRPTLISKIKNEINQIDAEVRK